MKCKYTETILKLLQHLTKTMSSELIYGLQNKLVEAETTLGDVLLTGDRRGENTQVPVVCASSLVRQDLYPPADCRSYRREIPETQHDE